MKIRKTDWMYKAYSRYFGSGVGWPAIPPPGNICNYFWKSVGGVCLWLLVDLRAVMFGVSVSVFVACICNLTEHPKSGSVFNAIWFVFSMFGSAIYTGVALSEWAEWMKARGLEWVVGTLVLTGVLYGLGCITLGFLIKPMWWGGLVGFGGAVSLILIIFAASVVLGGSWGEAMVSYMGGVKDKMCPLVEVEEKE